MSAGVRPEDIQPTQSLHNLHLLFVNTLNNKHSFYNPAEKARVAEHLYELNKQNISALERFSPTNDDLMNDSEDDGKDQEKIQKVNKTLIGPKRQGEVVHID